MRKKQIDIIIPVWTKKINPALYPCIESIIKNTDNFNLIISASDESHPININRGLDRCKSEYICIVDWDIVVYPGWLDKLVEALENDPKMGIVGPSIGGKQEEFFSGYMHEKDEVVDRGTVIGACMLFRNIGLRWDEKFPSGYWCDTDFGRQFKEKGYKIGLHGGAKIDHEVTTTLNESSFVNEMMEAGEMVYFTKWGDLYR